MDQLYREYILDHYKNPRNFGELEPHDVEFFDRNPLCGDEMGVHIRLDGDRDRRPALPRAGLRDLAGLGLDHLGRAEGQDGRARSPTLDRHFVAEEIGIELSPTRLKCGLLALKVVQGALLGTDEWPDGHARRGARRPRRSRRLRTEI